MKTKIISVSLMALYFTLLSTSLFAEHYYNYFDDKFIDYVTQDDGTYVLVATGWSQSSLGNMTKKKNKEKQKRAFSMSYLLANKIVQEGKDARLIYLTTVDNDETYRRYLYRVANGSEVNFDKFDKNVFHQFKFSTAEVVKPEVPHLPNDPAQFEYLRKGGNLFVQARLANYLSSLKNNIYKKNRIVGLTAHFTGPYLEEIAEELEIPYLANPSNQEFWIKKSKSRLSFKESGIPHPLGTYEGKKEKAELAADIYELLKEMKGSKIVLKLEKSAGGDGNKILNFTSIKEDKNWTNPKKKEEIHEKIMSILNDENNFSSNFNRRIRTHGAIIEELIVGKNFTSPATISIIGGKNKVDVFYAYNQVLGGPDGQHFEGSKGPMKVSEEPLANILEMSNKVANYLSEQGVRATVGTDFVTCEVDGKFRAYGIENNVRNTGTSYPYRSVMMIIGKEMLKERFIRSNDDVEIAKISVKNVRKIVQDKLFNEKLINHPLQLNKATGVGCLIHSNTFRLGFIGMVCAGRTSEEVDKLFIDFSKDIQSYIENLPETQEYLLKKSELPLDPSET